MKRLRGEGPGARNMSLINDLIRRARAKPRPDELTINDNNVGTIVEHVIALQTIPANGPTREELATMIRDGKLQFMAIPVRVLGAHASK